MKDLLFRLDDVWKVYEMKDVVTKAMQGVSLEVKKGEYIAILGPSGSGKSTVMHIMGCLDTPNRGRIFIEERDVSTLSEDDLAKIRRDKIGFVFQAYNLINSLTAQENVALPLRLKGVGKGEAMRKAGNLLETVGLSERMHHKPTELSGGQQQRVAIARALVNDPEAILADEPTGNLDSRSGKEIVELLENLHKKLKKTIVIVTHDHRLASRADRELHIIDGKIQKDTKNHFDY